MDALWDHDQVTPDVLANFHGQFLEEKGVLDAIDVFARNLLLDMQVEFTLELFVGETF